MTAIFDQGAPRAALWSFLLAYVDVKVSPLKEWRTKAQEEEKDYDGYEEEDY